MEYSTAPDTDKKRRVFGEEKPNPSRTLKAMNKRENTVALAERIKNEL